MSFHLYGFFISLGILTGILVAEKLKYCLRSISILDFLLWVIIPGIIGARIYHVINFYSYYSQNWIEVFYLWQGGLGIYGGIIGGIIGLWMYSWFIVISSLGRTDKFISPPYAERNKANEIPKASASAYRGGHKKFVILPALIKNFEQSHRTVFGLINKYFLQLLDLAAIGLPLGQAIGRIGNYFNQELYGLPTSLPWGIYINLENRLPGYEQFSKFHPLFLYESFGCLVIFIILLKCFLLRLSQERAEVKTNFHSVFESRANKSADFIYSKSQRSKDKNAHKNYLSPRVPGTIFFTYLFLYSFLRFWLEFLRINSWMVGEIRVNQLLALLCVLISTIYLLYKKRSSSVE